MPFNISLFPMVLSGNDVHLVDVLHCLVPKWVPALMTVVPSFFFALVEMAFVYLLHPQHAACPMLS